MQPEVEKRVRIQADLRKFFVELWHFNPFPATFTYENIIEFVAWRDEQSKKKHK